MCRDGDVGTDAEVTALPPAMSIGRCELPEKHEVNVAGFFVNTGDLNAHAVPQLIPAVSAFSHQRVRRLIESIEIVIETTDMHETVHIVSVQGHEEPEGNHPRDLAFEVLTEMPFHKLHFL